jgi:hypothetical protein
MIPLGKRDQPEYKATPYQPDRHGGDALDFPGETATKDHFMLNCRGRSCKSGDGSRLLTSYPPSDRFTSATVILPVINETAALEETVRIVVADVRDKLKEILIIVARRTTPAAMAVVSRLRAELPELVVVHEQTLDNLGGALREAFDLARGSHIVMMASDMETDPCDVKHLISIAQQNPEAIVTASRWLGRTRFYGYSTMKLVCNWLFQRSFAMLYGTRLTDLTFGYRLFPTKLVQSIAWEELRHPLIFETLVKPLRLGVSVIEIPSTWHVRTEGESQNPFFRNFAYFRVGWRVRFMSTAKILRPDPRTPSPPVRT